MVNDWKAHAGPELGAKRLLRKMVCQQRKCTLLCLFAHRHSFQTFEFYTSYQKIPRSWYKVSITIPMSNSGLELNSSERIHKWYGQIHCALNLLSLPQNWSHHLTLMCEEMNCSGSSKTGWKLNRLLEYQNFANKNVLTSSTATVLYWFVAPLQQRSAWILPYSLPDVPLTLARVIL